ncbi:MAG: hypothetical protein WBP61_08990 [Nocardioides sp.]
MSSQQQYEASARGVWAYGVGAFGGVILVTVGLFQFLQGMTAVAKDDVFLATPDYLYTADLATWGWIHLAIGTVAMVVGICVLYGQTWARAAGVLIAVLSAVASFAFLPTYPLWSMIVIAIDVLVIWALSSLIVNT